MRKISVLLLFICCINLYGQDRTSDLSGHGKNGWDYYSEGKYVESINALLEEKKMFPDRINIYVILGWDYKNLRNYRKMEQISAEGLRVNSYDTRVLLNLAEARYYQGKYAEAAADFQNYMAAKYRIIDYNVSEIYYYIGECFYNMKQYYKADIALSTAEHYRPNDYRVKLALAKTMEELKKPEEAYSLFESVLNLRPSNTEAIDGLKRLKDQVQ